MVVTSSTRAVRTAAASHARVSVARSGPANRCRQISSDASRTDPA